MVAKLNEKDKYAAILLSEDGYSCRQIAEKLNRHHSTISNILKRYNETGSVKERHRSGRPPISNARDQRHLIKIMKENRRQSSTELAKQWELSNGKQASARTVRRVLQNQNYFQTQLKPI